MVPTPHCSPCKAGLGATSSRAWLNLCSDPLAGLLVPAMDMAIPLLIRDLATSLALFSRPSLIASADSIISLAVIKDKAEADSL